jgi:ubiquinone/menaquinone biosynthesis C-methylase UbiE
MAHLCSHKHVWTFDNFLRPLIHNPQKIFGPHVQPGMCVLDVGCGAGFAALAMARLVGAQGKVVAVDVQPQMLAKVTRRAEKAGLAERIDTRQSLPDQLPVTGPFDFVNAFYMVHEVPKTDLFLRLIHACLKSTGRFLIVEPKFHVSRTGFDRMLQLAEKSRFAIINRPRITASRAVVLTKA